MTLEPTDVLAGGEEENTELRDMTRRFWVGAALSVPVFILAMWHTLPSAPGLGATRSCRAGRSLF